MRNFLLLSLILIIFYGCSGISAMPANEPVTDQYAYVVGKDGILGQWLYFYPDGDMKSPYEIQITNSDKYPVFKVAPGRYVLRQVGHKGDIFTGTAGSFTAEAGKITYIGDVSIRMHTVAESSTSIKALTSVDVQNNSEAVKIAIKKSYPNLAADLDNIFIYSPVRN